MMVENVGCSRSRADTALTAPQRRVTDHAPNSEHDKAPGGFSRLLRPVPLIKQCVRVRKGSHRAVVVDTVWIQCQSHG